MPGWLRDALWDVLDAMSAAPILLLPWFATFVIYLPLFLPTEWVFL